MRNIFFLVYCTLTLCSCEYTDEKLDITTDPKSVHHLERDNGGIRCHVFTPSYRHKLVELTEGDLVLWSRPTRDHICNTAMVYIEDGKYVLAYLELEESGVEYQKYYQKDVVTNEWKLIARNLYFKRLFRMLYERIFDINDSNTCIFNISRSTPYGNSVTIYNTAMQYNVVEVVEGDLLIWRWPNYPDGDLSKCCTRIIVHSRQGKKCLLSLEFLDGEILHIWNYRRTELSWERICTNEYRYLAYKLDCECSLDLSAVDADNFTLVSSYPYGNMCKVFSPKEGKIIKDVLDDDIVIWKASNNADERCIICSVYYKGNEAVLCQLLLDVESGYNHMHFEKTDEGWTSLETNEFYTKLGGWNSSEDVKSRGGGASGSSKKLRNA